MRELSFERVSTSDAFRARAFAFSTAKLRKLADPALAELAAQASRLGASSRTREIEHGPALVMHSLRRPRLDPTSISH